MADFFKDPFPPCPRLIFMGTPEFAVPTLRSLIEYPHDGLTVITQPDSRRGRGKKFAPPPVKRLALENSLKVLQPDDLSNQGFQERIRRTAPDLIIVVAFGRMLPKAFLAIPRWGVINIHASLLPRLRGAAPIQWAILGNESKTGLTVMHMDEGLDTGPILMQKEVRIQENETAGRLYDRLALAAGELITRFLSLVPENPVQERPQDPSMATYAPKITKKMGEIDWNRNASQVSSLIRAFDPAPGAFTTWQNKNIKLFSARPVEGRSVTSLPGRVITAEKGLLMVETAKGAVEIGEIQLPGKKKLSSAEFLRGFSFPPGALLGR